VQALLLQAENVPASDDDCVQREKPASMLQAGVASTLSIRRPTRRAAAVQAQRALARQIESTMHGDDETAGAQEDVEQNSNAAAQGDAPAGSTIHDDDAISKDDGNADTETDQAAGNSRKRSRPCPLAKRGRLHAPGTYVYDEVEAACECGQYSCGAALMPFGHVLEGVVYCNAALTCAAPIESTLYGMNKTAFKLPLVHFERGVCSICGVEKISDDARKEQGCSGNSVKSWAAYPLCLVCVAQGLQATAMHKTKAQRKRNVRAQKRALPMSRAGDESEESE
jgi:hypothetical protein